MSEVRLNIIDRERAVSGTCHGSAAARLSARARPGARQGCRET